MVYREKEILHHLMEVVMKNGSSTKTGSRLAVALMALMAVPVVACVLPFGQPATDTDCSPGAPFTCGGPYTTCPTNDTCPGGYLGGYTVCAPKIVTIKCSNYSGGALDPRTLCCAGGTYVGPSTTTVTITWQAGTGSCGFY